jgi:hypothetical protein
MAVYKLTPKAGKVTGTHTNFPVYMDFSAMGITTLAEAQSVRCYTDAGLTTEIAREVVSATEGHAKVPSLSSASEIYADYDGIRADYAVTDTYGRNAVWSDYGASARLDDVVDSTGGFSWTNTGGMTFEAGKFGSSVRSDGANGKRLGGSAFGYSYSQANPFTWSFWMKQNELASKYIVDVFPASGSRRVLLYSDTPSGGQNRYRAFFNGAEVVSPYINHNTWHKFDLVKVDGAHTGRLYLNGALVGSVAFGSLTYANSNITSLTAPGDNLNAGVNGNVNIDNFSAIATEVSADWITTEYNNQNDVVDFWDITPVGTASTGFFNLL